MFFLQAESFLSVIFLPISPCSGNIFTLFDSKTNILNTVPPICKNLVHFEIKSLHTFLKGPDSERTGNWREWYISMSPTRDGVYLAENCNGYNAHMHCRWPLRWSNTLNQQSSLPALSSDQRKRQIYLISSFVWCDAFKTITTRGNIYTCQLLKIKPRKVE